MNPLKQKLMCGSTSFVTLTFNIITAAYHHLWISTGGAPVGTIPMRLKEGTRTRGVAAHFQQIYPSVETSSMCLYLALNVIVSFQEQEPSFLNDGTFNNHKANSICIV